MQVLVTLSNSIGNGLGPNFSLTSNAGAVTPSLVSRTSLLNGVVIDVPNNATQITCTSQGNCTNSITLIITGIPIPTTTTSTTTIRPTTTTTTTTFSNGIPSQTTTTSTSTTTTTSTSTSSTTSSTSSTSSTTSTS
jgi:hypothetical protein